MIQRVRNMKRSVRMRISQRHPGIEFSSAPWPGSQYCAAGAAQPLSGTPATGAIRLPRPPEIEPRLVTVMGADEPASSNAMLDRRSPITITSSVSAEPEFPGYFDLEV